METLNLESHELWGRFTDPDYRLSDTDGFDAYWEWPEDLGFGYMGTLRLKPGFFIRIGRYTIKRGISIRFDPFNSYINFRFIFKGAVFHELNAGKRRNDFLFNPGNAFVSYLPGWDGKVSYAPGTCIEIVSLGVSTDFFENFVGCGFNEMPDGFRTILANKNRKNACYFNTCFSSELGFLLREILYCPYTGWMKKPFLEGKALELLVMVMLNISSSVSQKKISNEISHRLCDKEKMYEVKKTIENNLQNPPALAELSRQAGISHPKLNHCFKTLYGKTVFEYLREMRLKKAKLLLDEGKMNITEISYETGFSNPSHFSRSFKTCYGANPGEYLRRDG